MVLNDLSLNSSVNTYTLSTKKIKKDAMRIDWKSGPAIPIIGAVCLFLLAVPWGGVEIWHPDQMAFHGLTLKSRFPLSPKDFFKPPLLTYLNLAFSVAPQKVLGVVLKLLTGHVDWERLSAVSVWLSRTLQFMFGVSSVYLLWRIVKNGWDRAVAFVCCSLLATSAGFVIHAQFVTTDLPVVFVMLLAFLAAQRIVSNPSAWTYVLAGAAAGLAAAMKYNAGAVIVALPAFHFFANSNRPWEDVIFAPKLYLGVSMFFLGFAAANPYALIEWRRFLADLKYLIIVTPAYPGIGMDKYGWQTIPGFFIDLIGWPLAVWIALTMPIAMILSFRAQ